MIYLLSQSWGFLVIAWLIGVIVGGILMMMRKSQRQVETENDLRDSHKRALAQDKELMDMRTKLGELEGVPEAERRTRIQARQELIDRIAKLETDLSVSRQSERQHRDDLDELKRQTKDLANKLTEERARADSAERAVGARQESEASQSKEISALQARLQEALGLVQTRESEVGMMTMQIAQLEGRPAVSAETEKELDTYRTRIFEMEAQLKTEAASAAERTTTLLQRITDLEGTVAQLQNQPKTVLPPPEMVAELTAARREAEQAVQLRGRVNDLEQRLSRAQASADRVPDLEDRIEELEADLRAAANDGTQNDALLQRILALESEIARDKDQHADDVARLRDSARVHQDEVAQLKVKALAADKLETDLQNAKAKLVLAEQRAADLQSAGSDEAAQLKRRVQEMEAQLQQAQQPGAEITTLRARLADMEARLMDAQRAKDEAAILRAQIADMDGRLGQALRNAAEAETLRARVRQLEGGS
ncbi:MAG TPA: hypothetical protein DCL54_00155 [Alphaproteobacteria bacterium]|nr:hypothetical protein [Alphaproteobacteria bacterium]HAJ44977.1 hypothetical protein [Alphaproteobacteria bacterium]